MKFSNRQNTFVKVPSAKRKERMQMWKKPNRATKLENEKRKKEKRIDDIL